MYFDSTVFSVVTEKVKRPLVYDRARNVAFEVAGLFPGGVEDLSISIRKWPNVVPPFGRSIGARGRWLWFLGVVVERSVLFFSVLGGSNVFVCWILDDCRFRPWLVFLATAEGSAY